MNSFRFLEQGVNAEIERQTRARCRAARRSSRRRCTSTRPAGAITSLRSKEEAHDYRYFPEPDLVPIAITPEMLDGGARRDARAAGGAGRALRVRARAEPRQRPPARLPRRAGRLLRAARWAPATATRAPAQTLANWVTAELARASATTIRRGDAGHAGRARRARRHGGPARGDAPSARGARRAARRRGRPGGDRRRGGTGDRGAADELAPIVAAAIAANADAAEKIRAGKVEAIGPIIGHVMRETRGRADGGEVRRLVLEQLGA